MKTVPKSRGSKTAPESNASLSAMDWENTARIERVRQLLRRLGGQIGDSKCSVGDYIRLLQLEKELEAEEPPREIRVTWVDRVEAPDSGE